MKQVLNVLTLVFCYSVVAAQVYIIDTDYPGGNVIVSNTEITSTKYFHLNDDTVHICPDLRDTPKSWFYWTFMIANMYMRDLKRCL